MATATDDNAEIRNLDVRLFKKSTCWYTNFTAKYNSSTTGNNTDSANSSDNNTVDMN